MDSSGKSSPLLMKRSASDYADRLGRVCNGPGVFADLGLFYIAMAL
jgi:hypothetical protein